MFRNLFELAPLLCIALGALPAAAQNRLCADPSHTNAGDEIHVGPVAAMPMSFARHELELIENAGQWDTPALLIGRMPGGFVRLAPGAIELQLEDADGRRVLVRLVVEGGREDCLPEGEGPLAVKRNYFVGDRERWRSDVSSFAGALYREIVPGVDLRVREQAGHLKYDLLLAAGACCDDLVVRCEGTRDVSIDEDGSLLLATDLGPIRMSPPKSWIAPPGEERREIASGYRRIDGERFGFVLTGRDQGVPAVIDPGITWATYLGGSQTERIFGLAYSPGGDILVAGDTDSDDFGPTTAGVYMPSDPETGGWDGYIGVLDPTGSNLVSCTYLGGDGEDGITNLAVHANGDITVVGYTKSSNFPTSLNALQSAKGVGFDGFVATLDKTLSTLLYGSYLGDAGGGGSRDWATDVAVGGSGLITVGGYAQSSNFYTTAGAYQTMNKGKKDAFLTRLDTAQAGLNQVVWSTFLGGSDDEGTAGLTPTDPDSFVSLDLVVDASGVTTVSGVTHSSNFPTVGAYQSTYGGTEDGFVARLDPSQSGAAQLVWSTFLGGSNKEFTSALVVDASGIVTVSGATYSTTNFPTTSGAFQPSFGGGGSDGFVSRLDPAQVGSAQLVWSTYLGGSVGETALGLGVEPSGMVVASGWTDSGDFPTTGNAMNAAYIGGSRDAWTARLDASRTGTDQLRYSTFAGGSDDDNFGTLLSGDPGTVLLAGSTNSSGIATAGAYETAFSGARDVYIAHFEFPADAVTYCTAGTSASGCQARISAAGVASATAVSGFDLIATGVEGAKDSLFFCGTSGQQANSWGNGTSYQCVVPPVSRLGLLMGTGTNGQCDGSFTQDLNALWCPTCPKPQKNPGPGATVQAQLWYRDPQNTSNQTTSLSDAIEFVLAP